jgi:hypothetical protein
MLLIIIFAAFESLYFPHSLFLDNRLNPASPQDHFSLTTYGGLHFGMTDVRTYCVHVRVSDYSFSAVSFGNDVYRENAVAGGASFPVSTHVYTGFSVTMLNYWVKEYCNRFRYSMTAGFCVQEQDVSVNGWIAHCNSPRFNEFDEVPVVYSVELRYATEKSISLICAVRGTESELPFYNFGLTCAPSEYILLGLGANTDPVSLEYVVQVRAGQIRIDYAGKTHHYLGLSHFFGLHYTP